MKKLNLLSRAEMRKVMGGLPVILGCEVGCYAIYPDGGYHPVRVLAQSCSVDHQQAACVLTTVVPNSCGNCTIDNDEW